MGGMTGGVPDLGTPTQPNVTMTAPPETVSVNSGDPSQVQTIQQQPQQTMLPQQAQPQFQQPTMTPPAPAHRNWLQAAMGAVLDIMGGPKTATITHDGQGNYTVEDRPSTTGEKWARIAQAAVKGLAGGLQTQPGPANMAQAAGAGLQAGYQLPQQRQQQIQQQLGQIQQQQLFKANQILLDQQIVAGTDAAKQRGLTFAQEESNAFQQGQTFMESHANVKDWGTYNDWNAAMAVASKNQAMVNGHLDGLTNIIPQVSQGKITGFRVLHADQDWAKQRNTEPVDVPFLNVDAEGKSFVDHHHIPIGGATNEEIFSGFKSGTADILKQKNAEATEAGRTAAQQATAQYQRLEGIRAIAQARLDNATAREKAQNTGLTADGSDGMSWRQIVDGMKSGDVDVTKLVGIRNSSTLRAQLVSQAMKEDPTFSMQTYPTRLKVRQDYATGPESDQIQSFNQFLGHLKLLSQGVAQLRNTQSPLINVPLNRLRAMANSNPQAAEILPVVEAAQNEFQNFLHNNKALHQADVEAGDKILNRDMGPAAMEQAMKGMGQTAITRFGTVNEKYRRAMGGKDVPGLLDNEAQDALDITGLRPYAQSVLGAAASRTNTTAPNAGPMATPTPQKPAGATMQVPGSDGKMHWSDGRTDLGVVQ